MKVTACAIPDVLLIEPKVFGDECGFFFESFNQRQFVEIIGRDIDFVQDNHSRSARNVLRGLHYQIQQPQGKLVRVVQGEVFDVAVDLRADSPSYLQWHGTVLSDQNHHLVVIPAGCAHGFQTLADDCELLYLHTADHQPSAEGGVSPCDPRLAISWPLPVALLSDRDAAFPPLSGGTPGARQ